MRAVLAILFLLLLPVVAVGGEAYKLATSEYKPFCSESGGLVMDIVDASLAAVGAEAEYVFLPWKRCEICVSDGDCIGALPYSKNATRQKDFIFTDSMLQTQSVFFLRKDTAPSWDYQKPSSLKRFAVAAVPGYYYEEILVANNIRTISVKDIKTAMNMVLNGRADVAIDNEYVGWTVLQELSPRANKIIRTAKTPLRKGESSIMLKKNSPEAKAFRELFNMGLGMIKASGQYEEILNKHMSQLLGEHAD